MIITKDQIVAILPGVSHLDDYFPHLIAGMDRYQISATPQRAGAYLAQAGEETGKFRSLVELGNDAYFTKYDGRHDLGNTQPGDGVRFKGRGALMITGRGMYEWASKSIYADDRLIEHPEVVADPEVAFLVGAWVWTVAKGLNRVADVPETWIHPGPHQYTKFQWVTELINGGQNGYAERLQNYQRARQVLVF